LGVTAAMIRRAEQSGAITRLTHGVHIATDAVPLDPAQVHLQLALAVQLRNPTAIASHHTAALAWGLDLPDERAAAAAKPAFITPADALARSRSGGQFTVVPRNLPVQHRVEHPSGLRVTTRHRTAVDVAATLALPDALIVPTAEVGACLGSGWLLALVPAAAILWLVARWSRRRHGFHLRVF
jgi:hypothetical protein